VFVFRLFEPWKMDVPAGVPGNDHLAIIGDRAAQYGNSRPAICEANCVGSCTITFDDSRSAP